MTVADDAQKMFFPKNSKGKSSCRKEMRDMTYFEFLKRILELSMAQTHPKDRIPTDSISALTDAAFCTDNSMLQSSGSTCQRSLTVAA